MRRLVFVLLMLCIVCGSGGTSRAAVVTFTDRSAFQSAVGSALRVETFDALAGHTFSSADGLTVGGVNFVGLFAPDFFLAVVDDSTFPPLPAATSLATVNHLRITFAAPVHAVGFDVYVTSSVMFGFDAALDASFGNGDAATVLLPPSETFVGVQTTTPFSVLSLTTLPSFLAIDNFYVPAAAEVPEPAALTLIGIAVALGAMCRSRRLL